MNSVETSNTRSTRMTAVSPTTAVERPMSVCVATAAATSATVPASEGAAQAEPPAVRLRERRVLV
jgi:hypothetical protein